MCAMNLALGACSRLNYLASYSARRSSKASIYVSAITLTTSITETVSLASNRRSARDADNVGLGVLPHRVAAAISEMVVSHSNTRTTNGSMARASANSKRQLALHSH